MINTQKLGYQTFSEEFASDTDTQPDTQPHSSDQGATGEVPKPSRSL